MADNDKTEQEEEQYVAVEDDPNAQQQQQDPPPDDDKEDSEGVAAEEDERLAADQDDDDDKRKRKRDDNKTRRQRQKEARERTERELKFLRTRNAELEQRFSEFEQQTDARIAGSEIQGIKQGITKAKSDLALANQVIQQAVEDNDGKNLAEALTHRDSIRDHLHDLEQAEDYLSATRRAPAPQRELDPRHVAHAQQFMVDNDWWDPQGRDPESQKVLEIDRMLVMEGYNPVTRDYWDELRTRTQEALPARFDSRTGQEDGDGNQRQDTNGQQRQSQTRNRGPQFRTGGRERPLKKNEVYISPERKEAMIEAGVWDDPQLRNRYLKSYAEYDKQAQEGA